MASEIFSQAGHTYSASFDANALLIVPDDARPRQLWHNYPPTWPPATVWHALMWRCENGKACGLRMGALSTCPASTPKWLHLQWLTPLPSSGWHPLPHCELHSAWDKTPLLPLWYLHHLYLFTLWSSSQGQEPLMNWIFYLYLHLLCLGSFEQ